MKNLSIKNMAQLSKKKKKGFTLIELIIVIAIIAILAAIALPKFGAVKENSNKASDIANAKNISMAVSKAIAEDDVNYSSAITAAALTSVGSANIEDQLDGIKADTNLKTRGYTTVPFRVSVDTDGNVSVFAGGAVGTEGVEVYPDTNAAFLP